MMPKLSKRRKAFLSLIEKGKVYPLKEAIHLLKGSPTVKFDQTVEVSVKLDVDPKQSDQMVRGTVSLPHGTGRKIRVACFCKEDQQAKATEAGADIIGGADLIEKVKSGTIDFDIAIATPMMMKDLAVLGKILGPRGLMPNPKAGTVTDDVAKAIREVKKGRVEFKMDKQADIHLAVGKISFEEKAISENVLTFYEGLLKVRPASAKGHYIKSIALSSTMGPGMKLDLSTLKGEV